MSLASSERNIMAGRLVTQASSILALSLMVTLVACGGRSDVEVMAIDDPERVIATFMNAVTENNLPGMSRLWGTRQGLAANRLDEDELEKRLTVMRLYLQHEAYAILPGPPSVSAIEGERQFQVELTRRGCKPVVPFIVVRSGDGWLVREVDLTKAGNPSRTCVPDR